MEKEPPGNHPRYVRILPEGKCNKHKERTEEMSGLLLRSPKLSEASFLSVITNNASSGFLFGFESNLRHDIFVLPFLPQ